MKIDLTRSREFSTRFIEGMRGRGRTLIVAHDNPDPDSLAAAMALKHLILVKTGQESTIAFGGIIGRGENKAMVRELEIDAVPFARVDLGQFKTVCMVDTQPGTGNNSFPPEREVHLVVDHHPARNICRSCRWVDIREDYGASATILFEYLLAQEVTFGTRLSTILFYAIKSETQDLGREWCRADRDAYLHLLPLVNNRILFDIVHPEVPREYFHSYSRGIQNALIYGNILIFNMYDIDNPDIVAEIADFLLRVEGVELVLGMGCFGSQEILSFRTLSHTVFAGALMQAVVSGLGTAGGHGMMAGGQIPSAAGDRKVQADLERILTERLFRYLGRQPEKAVRLLPGPASVSALR